ncbi:unnamed protein product [Lactuca saligna]|uniref:Uncharacterized protein n=1 Tax=Lactuca saligna TaxID=75948 RepID=A0AA36DYJ4_LACSI|nr:unnamed protein product [Lactuca saligna]
MDGMEQSVAELWRVIGIVGGTTMNEGVGSSDDSVSLMVVTTCSDGVMGVTAESSDIIVRTRLLGGYEGSPIVAFVVLKLNWNVFLGIVCHTNERIQMMRPWL